MEFYDFTQMFLGKNIIERSTGRKLFKYQAFHRFNTNDLIDLKKDQHSEYFIMDKPGWKDGSIFNYQLAGIIPER